MNDVKLLNEAYEKISEELSRLDRVRGFKTQAQKDAHEFRVLMDEIAKSGLQYAITSYYGKERALELIRNNVGGETARKIGLWLNLNEEIFRELPIPKY